MEGGKGDKGTGVESAPLVQKGKASEVTAGQKIGLYVEKHRVPIVAVLALAVASVIGYSVSSVVSSRARLDCLSRLDAVQRTLTSNSSSLDDAALEARREAAMLSLKPLMSKSGVAGVRANMLAAEIAWQKGDYAQAAGYWKVSYTKSKRAFGKETYTYPLSMFNEAAALEESGKVAEAAECYAKAAKSEDFMLSSCALFNAGRAYEVCGEWKKALDSYNELISSAPSDGWANLARSRRIALEIAGKDEE